MTKNCTLAERFWPKVDRSAGPDACWPWTGSTGSGYGRIRVGKMANAHRIAWELTNGPIPEGEGYHGTCVCHRCDNMLCCNPSHLFLGTNADNAADRERKGRTRIPANKGEQNPAAKLTVQDVLAVRAADGTQLAIATRFGISPKQVRNIKSGRSWGRVA